ncbi:MAG: hypothetical protein HY245_04000 [Rhizobiales bacterium]|nr:hypothetical protein [Hyphomicrobiales bacterium]MBI3672585.1 hypothetical protein [Hyphomicrobiales bacterium]
MVEHPRIPYSRIKADSRRYFEPTAKMKAMGFEARALGPDGPEARAEALRLYEAWRQAKATGTTSSEKAYPIGSIGFAFDRYRRTDAWAAKAPMTRKKDWEWSWRFIEPIFGDVAPSTVQIEDIEELRAIVLEKRGLHTANRLIKTWRALWQVMSAMGYCDKNADPSKIIRNTAPKGRDATWKPGELARIGKMAWRLGYCGLAALLACCWDTQFSPGDARLLKASQRNQDARGSYFLTRRGKTGREVIGTLSKRSQRIMAAYLETLGAEPMGEAAIFRNRSGQPYSSDTLGDDFRAVREAAFPGDGRKLLDIRRSGAVEAIAGGADPAAVAAKMGNTIDKNRLEQETYLPNRTATVRRVDEARKLGRRKLRENET